MSANPMLLFRHLLIVLFLAIPPTWVAAAEDEAVDRAIVQALKFLAKEQGRNGSWEVEKGNDSTAVTSLAVMAFLAAGYVPGEGPYGQAINQGLDFVLDHQNSNGMLVNKRGHGPMYDHGICTLMLAEVAGMTHKDKAVRVRKALEKAVQLILSAQMVRKSARETGGWRYQHTSQDSDLSVTGWQLMALRASKDIGCDVPVESIDLAVIYVKKCSSGDGFGYQPGHGSRPALTGAGVLALQVCDHHDDDEVVRGIEYLRQQPLRYDDSWFFYGAYYNSISAFKYGGDEWEATKTQLFRELLKKQEKTGSWQARNPTEGAHGQIYSTSLSVLALTVEYGYLPIYQR